MIAFPCPACQVHLKVKDDLAGRTGKCPGCGRAVLVPLTSTLNDASSKPAAKRPSSAHLIAVQAAAASAAAAANRPTSVVDFSFLRPPQEPDEMGRLGQYRVLKVLGAGSMGIVFSAEDPQLKRLAALKVMRPNYACKEEYRLRFIREAQATAALDHPNVVPIYQVGEDHGVPFLAMKLLAGESLEDRLKTKDPFLPLPEVLRIGIEVADALGAAHARGLIHRDVKPTNIWLEAGDDRVKLIDFGLARILDDDLKLTGTGYVVGTPSYMAPEQANGEAVDHRSDLFSLGCVLYRASTGVVPFPGQFAVDVVAAVRTLNPKAPRELDPTLPPSFSDLVVQLLCKKAAGRPQSAQAVKDELEGLRREMAGGPARTRPPSGVNGLDKPQSAETLKAPMPAASRPWGLILALAAAAIVALGLAIWAMR